MPTIEALVIVRSSMVTTAVLALTLFFCGGCHLSSKPSPAPSNEKYTERDPILQPNRKMGTQQNALGMIKASRGALAPVYAPLAEQIIADFNLDKKTGIGIDLGSGPGTLIVELCKRTRLHWINADINPHFFPYFYRRAEKYGFGHRVSAISTDAHALAFRDNYADIIVSRGSFHLWEDKVKAFREIYRVLKPGAVAYIGRGFSRNLPVETAKKIRANQRGKLKYDVEKTADELSDIINDLGIEEYRIHRPKPPGGEKVNYGVWVEFHKPRGNKTTNKSY